MAEVTADHYPKYPHLENLDRVPQVLDAPYLHITEKIHGFNARFGWTEAGEFWVGSRNQVVDPAKDKLQGFSDWALHHGRSVPWALGHTFYGEWAGKGIQKGIDYGQPEFRLFAVRRNGELVSPDAAELMGYVRGIQIVPVLYRGPNPGMEMLDELRKGQSLLAAQQREGIVIVPWPPVYDQYGHQLIAKFKAPAFSERAHARKEQPAPADMANVQAFVDDYVTMERMHHVLDQVAEELRLSVKLHQLREEDTDVLAPLNTGRVLRQMVFDIQREGRDDLAKLSENEQKMLGKVSNAATKVLMDGLRLARMGQLVVDR